MVSHIIDTLSYDNVMETSCKQRFKTQSLSETLAVLDPSGLEPSDLELPGLARPGARAGTRVVARVGARVGASSLLGLLPLALAAVVDVHQPQVGQHLLG